MKRTNLKRKSTLKRSVGPKKAPRKRATEKSVSKLMKDADMWFSRFVRLSHAKPDGTVNCYTCGYETHYKKLDNGHYISRYYKHTRWDERNCRPQCRMCNIWKKGDPQTFREKLVEEYGQETVEEMEAKRKLVSKLTREWMNELVDTYKPKVEALLEE